MKFFDTNIFLRHLDVVDKESFFLISSVTLQELENIKTSKNKTEEIRYAARKATRYLDENSGKYRVVTYKTGFDNILEKMSLEPTNDYKILASATTCDIMDDDLIFVTNDILAKIAARDLFNLKVESVAENTMDEYKGFIEKSLSDEEMAYFYTHTNENIFGLMINEYFIMKNSEGKVVDRFRWDGTSHVNVSFENIKSAHLGRIKPYGGDIYQQLALNSMCTNQLTLIKGPAGTGKSYLSLGYLFYLLENDKINKIVIFCNTVATANSARLGYYPGTRDEKLLDSQIGNMLSSKLGSVMEVEKLIADDQLILLPMSDIRGYDTNGMNAGIYITEAQNTDISLMKLALQRIGDDSICIVEGDYNAQTDLSSYSGANNGMRRVSEIFRGQDFYGEVELQNIYRSKIAEIAERM